MTARYGAAAVAAATALLAGACGHGDPGGTDGGATTAACADCRTLGVGRDPRLGAASVGVRHCAADACDLSIRAADGSVTRPTVRAGDTFAADGPWIVVRTGPTGLVVRPR